MKTEVLKNFIVLEGLDGSGTTTQLKNLTERLQNNGIKTYQTFEPTDNPIGKLIRSVLQKKHSVTPKAMSKLFVADRFEHLYGSNGIKENLAANKTVICDRYLFSSLAYQSPQCGFDFVHNINKDFPLPEFLIFIEVPVDTCQSRITKRGEDKELFEESDYQKQVYINYKLALDKFNNSGMKIHIIDGTQTPENITNEIWSIIRQ